MDRRQFLTTTAGLALGGFAAPSPAIAQAKTKVRVGYLHTVAVDGQIWTGMDRGTFDKQGLDLELRQFTTGLEIFQAMIGGSLDVLATGAVLSNFPARGQGKVFLVNDIEFATAQLWVRADQGIKSFADLKGKQIATATGTTAHVFLDKALRANKIDPKDVGLLLEQLRPERLQSSARRRARSGCAAGRSCTGVARRRSPRTRARPTGARPRAAAAAGRAGRSRPGWSRAGGRAARRRASCSGTASSTAARARSRAADRRAPR